MYFPINAKCSGTKVNAENNAVKSDIVENIFRCTLTVTFSKMKCALRVSIDHSKMENDASCIIEAMGLIEL